MDAVAVARKAAARQHVAMQGDEGIHWLEWTAGIVGGLLGLGGLADMLRALF